MPKHIYLLLSDKGTGNKPESYGVAVKTPEEAARFLKAKTVAKREVLKIRLFDKFSEAGKWRNQFKDPRQDPQQFPEMFDE